jgi:hypothetical protein
VAVYTKHGELKISGVRLLTPLLGGHVEKEFFINSAAAMLGTTGETLRNWEKAGVVSYKRVGTFRVVTLADIAVLRAHMHRVKKKGGRPRKGVPQPEAQG